MAAFGSAPRLRAQWSPALVLSKRHYSWPGTFDENARRALECGGLLPLSPGQLAGWVAAPYVPGRTDGREQARATKAAASHRTPRRLPHIPATDLANLCSQALAPVLGLVFLLCPMQAWAVPRAEDHFPDHKSSNPSVSPQGRAFMASGTPVPLPLRLLPETLLADGEFSCPVRTAAHGCLPLGFAQRKLMANGGVSGSGPESASATAPAQPSPLPPQVKGMLTAGGGNQQCASEQFRVVGGHSRELR